MSAHNTYTMVLAFTPSLRRILLLHKPPDLGRRQMIGSGTCLTTYRGQKFLCSPDSGDACTEWPDERKPAAQPLKPK